MRLLAFPQWDKLTSLLRGMARQSAADYAQRKIVRIIPKNGIAHLANYAANLLAVEGGKTTIIMPDMTPGKARDFMLRVTASGDNEIVGKRVWSRARRPSSGTPTPSSNRTCSFPAYGSPCGIFDMSFPSPSKHVQSHRL